jgi:UDP-GlcNAc:undecaprenyl-phosphate GlcNAc-1-phosphate transferase
MINSNLILTIQGGVATFLLSILFTRLLIYINIPAIPLSRSSHQITTPSAGGLAMVIAFIFGLVIELYRFSFLKAPLSYLIPYIASILTIGIISFLDDCRPISYRVRLFVHLLGALMIAAGGFDIKFPAFPFLNNSLFSQAFTVFSLVSLINATNFLDGLNGLLAGSIALTLGFIVLMSPLYSPSFIYALLLIAAILGFLIFNFPRGKIFMGDIGSTFLGLSLGFIALLTQSNASAISETAWIHKGFILSLTPMAFLWFDVGFTLVRRAFLKRRLTEPHRDHLFHLLNDKGYSHLFVSNLHFLTVIVIGGLSLYCYYGLISFITLISTYTLLQTIFCWWVFRRADAMAR